MNQDTEKLALIKRVQNYTSELLKYGINQDSADLENLEEMSIGTLKDLANNKSIKLQQCIDDGMEQTKNNCSYKGWGRMGFRGR